VKFGYLEFKRVFDVILSGILLALLSPLILIITLIILIFDGFPIIYWSDRIGVKSGIFKMPKYRTMKRETPAVATNLLRNPDSYMANMGPILRRTSLDELPQLWSIFIGDMSFVGPRPALFNQVELISARKRMGVDQLKPGLTGLAQVNGRDELTDDIKVQFDAQYLKNISFNLDLKIILMTFTQVILGKNVSH
jgi:O-antigen biosynthesis protein WbqP